MPLVAGYGPRRTPTCVSSACKIPANDRAGAQVSASLELPSAWDDVRARVPHAPLLPLSPPYAGAGPPFERDARRSSRPTAIPAAAGTGATSKGVPRRFVDATRTHGVTACLVTARRGSQLPVLLLTAHESRRSVVPTNRRRAAMPEHPETPRTAGSVATATAAPTARASSRSTGAAQSPLWRRPG